MLVLFNTCGARPSQLGLTWEHGWRNVALGVIAAMVLTPVVLGVNALAVWLFQLWGGVQLNQHPLFGLRNVLKWFEWIAVLLQVLVCAPVLEELLCRGLIQPWLCQQRWWGHLVMVLLSLTLTVGSAKPESRLAATLFVLAILPFYGLVLWRAGLWPGQQRHPPSPPEPGPTAPGQGEAGVPSFAPASTVPLPQPPATEPPLPGVGPALFGTALLFGMAHSAVWPNPIALFVLGLGLGWLAWRTQSLVGPIVLHALFNAVGSIGFLSR